MKVKLDEISLDEDIYPRQRISHKTVESYVEAFRGGAIFPPIEVQKIHVKENEKKIEKLICLDGWHRILAYKEYNKWIEGENKERKSEKLQPVIDVEAIPWKDWIKDPKNVLDRTQYLEELRIESARKNLTHGDRLSPADLEFHLLKIARDRPVEKLNGIESELAEKFGYSLSYISQLIGSEVRARKASRDAQIYRFLLLGWAQKEIGGLFGLAQRTVSDISEKFTSEVSAIQNQFYEKRKTASEIAKFYNLDDITVWAIVLEGKNDEERFKFFGKPEFQDDAPRLYNVWNIPQRDPRLGYEKAGNIPGQIAVNVLYYYTKQGDLVVDPMAGGGSTIDACLIMGRKCRAYDIANEWEFKGTKYSRKDIIIRDLWTGFADECNGCDFIFLDPPYWRLEREFYAKKSVSESPLEGWRAFMKKIATNSYHMVKDGGHVALVIEAFLDELVTAKFLDLPFECACWFKDAGFEEVQRIGVPMPSQIKSELDVVRYKKKKVMLDLNRDLIIFRKA